MSHAAPESTQAEESAGLSPAIKVTAVLAALGAGVALLIFGGSAQNAFVYSKLVHEVVDEPAQFQGRKLRVEGELKQGSVQFREDPCEWRFVLEKDERELPVRFPQCVVPDTFRDGMGISVTVQGELENGGGFLASQVVPRCPSKYEMDERKKAGESMPHGPVPASSGLGLVGDTAVALEPLGD